ncbi:hypothetical protein [Telluria aromaticivorans]|uniref:Uncharacterized protein n=1 Tax=Telluria aromaticivorans TaxID=2725995 RepID=A0A7Y2P043_9BURK|nr:hypothetical protein [Telluria aromaticivorans]NNG23788.1 hypothetical protein [Telluria aromaticivorans]
MNFSSFRTVSIIALSALLTACGAGQQDTQVSVQQGPMQLASTVSSTSAAPAAAGNSAGMAIAAAVPNSPVPDCAAEGCASLRIIDGNAEAYRIDAMRRAAAVDGSGQS